MQLHQLMLSWSCYGHKIFVYILFDDLKIIIFLPMSLFLRLTVLTGLYAFYFSLATWEDCPRRYCQFGT